MYQFEVVLTPRGYHGRFVIVQPHRILWYTSDRRTRAEIIDLISTIVARSQRVPIVDIQAP